MPKPFFGLTLFATVLGAGYLPKAPGTFGAAIASICLLPFIGYSTATFSYALLSLAISLTIIGAIVAKKLEPEWGKDPKQYVMDEFVGILFSIITLPISIKTIIISFILFRIFDIWKPLGIRKFEKIPNGWGVMMDDVAAGLVANLCLHGILFFVKL
jgi:phosphatidylglycerophosphatase A